MATTTDVAGFFADEWARFWKAFQGLDPEEQAREERRRAQARARAGQANTVSLPGWDDVIHLAPRYEPTKAERDEYYAARRERRPARIPEEAITEIERRRASAQRIATSTTPGYAQAWGQMLTAIDNIQDFTTSVATLGRLALWPAIRTLDAVLPRFAAEGWARTVFGATPEAAERIAQLAGRAAAADAYRATLARTAAEYAAAAAAGLERSALYAAGREAAEAAASAAARAAYTRSLSRAAAGLGTRLLGRLIPGLGWILLVGDLINLLGWLGASGMIGYAAACFGPRAGLAQLAARVATTGLGAAGPCGIREKVSQLGELNPFSQTRRATRAATLARATPNIGNLIELLQTTDQFFGVGISFGAIVGAFTEGAYAAELSTRGDPVSRAPSGSALGAVGVGTGLVALQTKSWLLGGLAAGSLMADVVGRTATAPLRKKLEAAQQLQHAPAINGTQETFTELEHIEQLVNYVHALDLVGSDLAGLPWQAWLAEQLPLELAPPIRASELTLAIIRETDPDLTTLGRWPMPGGPRTADSSALLEWGSTSVARAMRDFLEPRRADAVGMFAGGLYNMITDKVWAVLEPGPRFMRPEYTPEWRALLALGETARVVNIDVDDSALWAWWQDMLGLAEQKHQQEITPGDLEATALRRGVQLIHVEEPFLRVGFT